MQTRLPDPTCFRGHGISDHRLNLSFRLKTDQCGEHQEHRKGGLKTTDFIKWTYKGHLDVFLTETEGKRSTSYFETENISEYHPYHGIKLT